MASVTFASIKERLAAARVYFTTTGVDRLQDADSLHFQPGVAIEPYAAVLRGNMLCTMGSFSYSNATLHTHLTIGRYCSIAPRLTVAGVRHPHEWLTTSPCTYDRKFLMFDHALQARGVSQRNRHPLPAQATVGPTIGNDVWIGSDVQLGRRIHIGHGAVVAARSVVTRDVPPYAIVGGNPAKVIKYRFSEQVIERLLALAWWDFHLADLGDVDWRDVDKAIATVQDLRERGDVRPYQPPKLVLGAP